MYLTGQKSLPVLDLLAGKVCWAALPSSIHNKVKCFHVTPRSHNVGTPTVEYKPLCTATLQTILQDFSLKHAATVYFVIGLMIYFDHCILQCFVVITTPLYLLWYINFLIAVHFKLLFTM
jgi:hypothetical protein